MSVVCGAMFGEERVNNSVDLLSRLLVTFSVGQISALVAVILKSKRRLCLQLPHQHESQMARLCSPQDDLFVSWDVQSYCTFAATCCYRRLNVIEPCNHARLACFLLETNQHFVGSARIAGLFFLCCICSTVETLDALLETITVRTNLVLRAFSAKENYSVGY